MIPVRKPIQNLKSGALWELYFWKNRAYRHSYMRHVVEMRLENDHTL